MVHATPSRTPVVGILLAAGSGTRMGHGPKALLTVDGQPLAFYLADQLLQGGCDKVLLVIGAGADHISDLALPQGVRLVYNAEWTQGLSTSFVAGVSHAPTGSDVIMALVDQPGLKSATVQRLISARHNSSSAVLAAGYRNDQGQLKRGHPLLMSAFTAREAATTAAGDAGARAWLATHPEDVDLVDCSDLDSGLDIDTAEELAQWNRQCTPYIDTPPPAS